MTGARRQRSEPRSDPWLWFWGIFTGVACALFVLVLLIVARNEIVLDLHHARATAAVREVSEGTHGPGTLRLDFAVGARTVDTWVRQSWFGPAYFKGETVAIDYAHREHMSNAPPFNAMGLTGRELERACAYQQRLFREHVYSWCMSRTNIDIDDQACQQVMDRYHLTSKRDAVNYALRLVAAEALDLDDSRALRGSGWEGDLEELRSSRTA